MKTTVFGMALAVLLVIATQASGAPPPRHAGGGSHGPPAAGTRHHAHPHAHPGGSRHYWGPRVGVYYGPGFGYWGAVNYGWPWGRPYPYGYPFAYAPIVINATPITQTYIQQEPIAEAAVEPVPTMNYWYYCTQPAGYFPYIQNCSQPWIKVIPQKPANQQ